MKKYGERHNICWVSMILAHSASLMKTWSIIVVSWKRYSNGIINTFVESIENACTRNVKIRFIVEEPQENKISKNLIELCRGKSCCQIRFIPNQPKAIFSIYDQNQILIPTITKMDLQSSPALWSNNDALISLALEHFEEIWRKAKKRID